VISDLVAVGIRIVNDKTTISGVGVKLDLERLHEHSSYPKCGASGNNPWALQWSDSRGQRNARWVTLK
jgi:hypothetical protein